MKNKELELELLRLKSLCYRAAEEIIMLDNRLIEASKDASLLEEEAKEYGTFTSINLLSRLTGRIKGSYMNCYPELELQKKVIEGHYQVENSIFYGYDPGYDSTKWYDCAHCDAGYVDQECTCCSIASNQDEAILEDTGECPKGSHGSLDEALACWKCQNASQKLISNKT